MAGSRNTKKISPNKRNKRNKGNKHSKQTPAAENKPKQKPKKKPASLKAGIRKKLSLFSAHCRGFLNAHSRFLFLLLVLILTAAATGLAVRWIRTGSAPGHSGRIGLPAVSGRGGGGEAVPMTADGRPAIISADGSLIPVIEVQPAASVVIAAGDTAADAAASLKRAGIITSSRQLKNYLVRNDMDRSIQSGVYRIPQGLPVRDAADILLSGSVDYFDLRIFPGMTIREIISRLDPRFPDASADELLARAERKAAEKGYPFLEGFCFPGRYRCYNYGLSVEAVVDACLAEFERAVAPWWNDIGKTAGDSASLVIIASMIQRETQNSEEMPFIAGIIYNRLEADMPLGIDATIRYELGDWQNPLTKAALARDTPFNTRINRGLPPAPIGSPGLDALKAALHPTETDYFYYLHDPAGIIHYGKTYEDHLRNVDEYLR